MNYDVFGTFSSVDGPNAPLNDTCAASGNQQGSAVSAVAAWTKAGFPADKIVLGVPAYGHSYTVPTSTAVSGSTLNIYTAFDKTNIPIGDSWDPPTTTPDICGNPPVGNGNSGVYNFWALIQDGFLNQDGSVASGMNSLFDQCSQTVSTSSVVAASISNCSISHSFTTLRLKSWFPTTMPSLSVRSISRDHNDHRR
jgi:chitinase